MRATITKGVKTAGHGNWLRARGYEVTETVTSFEVECSGFVDELLDLSDSAKALETLQGFIKEKKLLTYKTKAIVLGRDGEKTTRSSILLCAALGAASALVAKPAIGALRGNALAAALAAL